MALFPGEDQFGGRRAAEKVMALLRKRILTAPDGRVLEVTLAAGLTVLAGRVSVEEAIEGADRYLYAALAAGGNRVVSNESEAVSHRERILVFAQDQTMARVMGQILEKCGFEVVVVDKNGEAALNILTKEHYDLVIVEEQLTGASGFDILSQLRALPRFNRLPIVMLTSSEENTVRALELGANDYLVKPFSPFAFVSRLRRILSHGMTGATPDADRRSVLVVDDEISPLIIGGTALDRLGGFRVLLAKGWQDGLKRLRETRVDLVLLDVDMPDIGASDLVRMFTESIDAEKTAIILTADGKREDFARQVGQGRVKGVIVKPFNAQTLPQEVAGLVSLPNAGQKPTPLGEQHLNSEIQRIVQATKRPA